MKRKLARGAAGLLGLLAFLFVAFARADVPRAELEPKYTNAASRFVTVDGVALHVRDEGPRGGAPIVLLHGTSSSLHTWDAWTTRLATKRRVIRVDLPGFGLTGPSPSRDYGARRQADVVRALMTELGVERADVAGSSYGGQIALVLALDAPARVRKLVLVDAAGLSGLAPNGTFAMLRTPILRDVLTLVTPRALVRKNVREAYGDPDAVDEATVDRYDAMVLREGNRRALVDRLNGPRDPDLDDRLAELHLPVLVMWGERDRRIPRSFAERFATGIPGAQLVTYPSAGHLPMEEAPDATVADLERFLDGP